MKTYVQYFITDHRGTVELLGSDGVCFLDGRWNLPNLEHAAKEQASRVRRKVTHYQVRKGGDRPFTNYRNVTGITPI